MGATRKRLTVSQVHDILRRLGSGTPAVALAREYGVTEGAISRIKHGTRLRSLEAGVKQGRRKP